MFSLNIKNMLRLQSFSVPLKRLYLLKFIFVRDGAFVVAFPVKNNFL